MNQIKAIENERIKFILSYANIFTLCFSVLYSILLLLSHLKKIMYGDNLDIFPIFLTILIPIIFLCTYILNLKNKIYLSKIILISTILVINFAGGVRWGFDLPSILLSYLFCVVILALTSKSAENSIYIFLLILSIFIGYFSRNYLNITSSWYNSGFYINDIIEFSIMFIFISFLLIKFNQEQNKTLNRALRAENILRKERDQLESTVKEKTREIKQMQMEEISKMYHLIEFGKLSSGLYHDLITPIQTMSLHIEKLTESGISKDNILSKTIDNIKNTHSKLISMLQNIRKQIGFKLENEKFNLTTEVNELVGLVKNNYFKNDVEIIVKYDSVLDLIINTKKTIVNHVILNLISNGYEACLQDKTLNNKEKYEIVVVLGKHELKNYISISDNGIGIKNENLDIIFDHFYSSKDRGKENCGVGLSSAKYYTEKYLNGKIYVESEYNIGTTMTVLF